MGYGMPLPEANMPWVNQNYEMVPVPMNGNNQQQYRMIDEREVFLQFLMILLIFKWEIVKKRQEQLFIANEIFEKLMKLEHKTAFMILKESCDKMRLKFDMTYNVVSDDKMPMTLIFILFTFKISIFELL